jgi:hypothetical protein
MPDIRAGTLLQNYGRALLRHALHWGLAMANDKRPARDQVTISIDPSLHEKLELIAKEERRTLPSRSARIPMPLISRRCFRTTGIAPRFICGVGTGHSFRLWRIALARVSALRPHTG